MNRATRSFTDKTLLIYVPYVSRALRVHVPHVHCAIHPLVTHVPRELHGLVSHVFRAFHALILSFYVSSTLMCFVACVLLCLILFMPLASYTLCSMCSRTSFAVVPYVPLVSRELRPPSQYHLFCSCFRCFT